MSSRLSLVPALLLALALACLLAAPASADAEALKRGSRGPLVEQVQQKLGLTVDGIIGPQTASALGVDLAEGHTAAGGRRSVRVPSTLERIAQCESGGNPRAVSSDGTYRGKYQFDRQTWQAMGGHGDPARASEAEQDRRALALYRDRGTSPWPACGA